MMNCHSDEGIPQTIKYHISFIDEKNITVYYISIIDFDERTAYIRACERFAASEGVKPERTDIDYEHWKIRFPYETFNAVIIPDKIA